MLVGTHIVGILDATADESADTNLIDIMIHELLLSDPQKAMKQRF
jgi:hypothetical protein